jgi:hypothetical protein
MMAQLDMNMAEVEVVRARTAARVVAVKCMVAKWWL